HRDPGRGPARRHQPGSPGPTASRLCRQGQRHRGQQFADFGRRRRPAGGVRARPEGTQSDAAGALRVLRRARRAARHHGHRPQGSRPRRPEESRPDAGPDGLDRAERSLCRAVPGRDTRPGPERGRGQPHGRRHRPGPPPGRHGRDPFRHHHPRPAPPQPAVRHGHHVRGDGHGRGRHLRTLLNPAPGPERPGASLRKGEAPGRFAWRHDIMTGDSADPDHAAMSDRLMTADTPAPLTELSEWKRFALAAQTCAPRPDALDLIEAPGLALDSSGQRHSPELMAAGEALLRARDFETRRERLLAGDPVNVTEGRAAWHTALRAPEAPAQVRAERERMDAWVRRADAERRWRHVVHVGIGGSDWGVRLAVTAFGYAGTWRDVRFVANIDGHAIEGGLAGLDPRETLVVLVSKSFTTAETLENGARAREWLAGAGLDPAAHLAAVTARPDRARAWGVPDNQIFHMWDWVGGRFSLWSAVGLSTALAVGIDVLEGLRAGAAAMDAHFAQAPLAVNAPVRMALAGVVNRSVLGHGSLNIAPYDSRLANLVPYVQ